jgi:hypothetical protein
MTDLTTGIEAVHAKVADALRAAEGDTQASPVLVAVVREFAAKADKATRGPGADAVIELEQAGDSAKAAAEADPAAGPRTKELVLDAHLAICMLKASVVTAAT